jgi:hypothetical protein
VTPFDDYETQEFVAEHPANYLVGFVRDSDFVPFYVGETGHLTCRNADYVRAAFAAPTDFKVGTAIRSLRIKGFKILLKHRIGSTDPIERKEAQDREIAKLKSLGYTLLNDLRGYSYRSSTKAKEEEKVENFLTSLLLAGG